MIINCENICGFRFDDEIVCFDCVRDTEWECAEQDDVTIARDADYLIICDRCKKRIQ